MRKRHFLHLITFILLLLLTACGPDLSPGVDLSGKNLNGRDLRGVDLTGANLSSADLSNVKMGVGGNSNAEKSFSGMHCAQLLNNSTLLALCDKDSIKLWDTKTHAFTQTIMIPKDWQEFVLSPDGKMLAIVGSGFNNQISILNTKTNETTPLVVGENNISNVHTFAWSPDGSYLALAGPREAWVWDVKNNSPVDTIKYDISTPAWSKDSKTLAYYNYQTRAVEFWNIPVNNRDRTLDIRPNFINWSPDDKTILMVDNLAINDNPIGNFLDVESGNRLHNLENLQKECGDCQLKSTAWSSARPVIAGGTSNGTIVIWDAETGSIIRTLAADDSAIEELQWSDDGMFLLSSGGGAYKLWNTSEILRTTNLTGANLRNANLSGADLVGLDLTKTTLTGANFSGVNLRGANLFGSDLRTITFTNADLSYSNLANSNLTGADLSGVNFTQAKLENTNLTDANMRGAKPIEYILKPVCKGIGIGPMQSYASHPGIHPLVVLTSDGEIHPWNNKIDEKWRATNDHLPEVVACVGEYSEVEIDECRYGVAGIFANTYPLMQSSVKITLRDAHSGSIIANTIIAGPISTCPYQVEMGTDIKSMGGEYPLYSDARSWLDEYIEK